jgi:cytochrome c-type biogenesis protein CcmH/NrfF
MHSSTGPGMRLANPRGQGVSALSRHRPGATLKIVTARIIRYLIPLLALAVFIMLPRYGFSAPRETNPERVGNEVYCLCGCVTTLNHCPHLPSQCESRAEITASILKDIHQGKDEQTILQDLARQYGVKVLAAPPAKGFYLAAWVLPGFGLVVGLIVVILILRRLRTSRPGQPPQDETLVDSSIMAAVEEEMKRTVLSDE